MTSLTKIITLFATLMTIATAYQSSTKAQQQVHEFDIIVAYERLLLKKCE
ncbi:hypothetical protein KAR91_84565 [Candidatus Pacearchaeota archaeon]|nr:hypothetical protein [Candidatus Pacearchaeota archaeon]